MSRSGHGQFGEQEWCHGARAGVSGTAEDTKNMCPTQDGHSEIIC